MDSINYQGEDAPEVNIQPGDEIFIRLDIMQYYYQWDKKSEQLNHDWWENPSRNLGVINLK